MNSYRDEMKLCAPCSLMEVALQESEDQAAAALRRSLAVRKLIAGGMAAAPSKPVLFDQLAAYFDYDADSPSCTLGVILNLMLVQEGLRPSFCVQEADHNASNDFVYDRATWPWWTSWERGGGVVGRTSNRSSKSSSCRSSRGR